MGSSHSRSQLFVTGTDPKRQLPPASPRVFEAGSIVMEDRSHKLCPVVQCSPGSSVPSLSPPGPLGERMAFGEKSHSVQVRTAI